MVKVWTSDERYNANLVRISNRKVNEFRVALNNTFNHELAKFIKFWQLRKEGHNVIVEAIFRDSGLRADLFDITDSIAYEIVHSEKEASILRKKRDYPVWVEPLTANEILNTNEILKTTKLVDKDVKK